jgi:hypothetical protein
LLSPATLQIGYDQRERSSVRFAEKQRPRRLDTKTTVVPWEVVHVAARALRPCWQNCYGSDDRGFLSDGELLAVDAMEDSIAPLDEGTIQIRRLITGFEACYHEADKEAEFIAAATGAGQCPERSNERPPERRKELENARHILSAWCENPGIKGISRDVGGIRADDLLNSIGTPNLLKIWQVRRIVDKLSSALILDYPYHNLALDVGDYGEPGARAAGLHYKDDSTFLLQTRDTIIHDTVDGRESKVSLAFAIDLLMPCGWDFVGYLVTILKAVGGDLRAERPLACCARNIRLSPLCDRLRTISNTLEAFWRAETEAQDLDGHILVSLGTPTPVKRWLAASLDKTIRLHLGQSFDMDLF